MKKTTTSGWMLLACAMLIGTPIFVSCSSDKDIDLGELDKTIGIGSDGFQLPTSSTKDSPLGDLLEIKEGDCIDTLANGDYQFTKKDTIDPATPKVKQVSFGQQYATGNTLTVPVVPGTAVYDIPLSGVPAEVASFKFTKKPEDDLHQISSLKRAVIQGNIKLVLHVEALAAVTDAVDIDLFLPDFFGIDVTKLPSYSTLIPNSTTLPGYEELKLTNVTTQRKLEFDIALNELKKFANARPATPLPDNYIFVNSNDLEMQGLVKMLMHMSAEKASTTGSESVVIDDPEIDQNIVVTHAEGYFNPDIDLDPSHVDINDVPDFLNDDRVNIKLHNPQIKLTIDNNVDVKALITGVMTAIYEDGSKKQLDVTKYEDIVMDKASVSTTSVIELCRYKPATPVPGVQYIELNRPSNGSRLPDGTVIVEDIAEILNKIPTSFDFTFTANADPTEEGSIDLYKDGTENDPTQFGCGYKIEPIYEFVGPLALEAGSTIVYNDTINDWNKDIKDNKINFYGEGHLMIEASIDNNTPLELVITKPTAIGLEKKVISDAKVEIVDDNGNVQKALTVYKKGDSKNKKLRLKISGNLDNLDGVIFEVVANATQATPEVLNASGHTVKIKDMKISLNGRVTLDLDD